MTPKAQSVERQSAPSTFSLGTLFLIVTCIGVASVAFRFANDGDFGLKISLAVLLVGGFLTLWFLATRQFRRLRLAGCVLAAGLVATIAINDRPPRIYSYRNHCAMGLRQIGLALANYHSAYGSFPPAFVADAKGKPLYSWRVLILPYLEESSVAKSFRYDEAWDGPNNAKVAATQIFGFGCPADPQSSNLPSGFTSYLGVVGPNTAWAGTKPRRLSEFKNPAKTILLVEVADSGIHWAEPRDLYFGQMSLVVNPRAGQGISSDHAGGAWVLFADYHVEFLPDSIDPKKLAEMLDLDGCNGQAAIDGDIR